MSRAPDLRDADKTREMVLYAAVAELAAKNVGDFNLEGVAARAGIDTHTVKQLWANTPELFTAALIEFGDRYIPIPDTGTLRGDLLEYSKSYAMSVNSPIGRRLLDALIVKPKDWDVAGSRETFLDGRHERITAIVRRGIERGECAADTDPVLLIDMLGACLCTPLLFYDLPVTGEHCEYVVDLVLNGIRRS
jgi:AcrR family transcriptional regulator